MLYESPELTNTKSFEEDKNFWMPFFESTNSRPDGNLEAINAEMGEANNLHLKVIDEKYCCFIRVESLRYIYMVKKETIEKLKDKRLAPITYPQVRVFFVIFNQRNLRGD